MSKLLSSVNSECLVLGGLILHMEWLIELGDLKVDYFSVDANKIIFGALKRLYKGGSTTCDIMDIYAIIETNGKDLEKVEDYGGVEYISTLVELADGKELGDIKSHSKIIVDCAYKNELSATLDGLKGFLGNNQNKPREYISRAVESELLELKSKYTTAGGLKVIGDDVDKYVEVLNREGQKDFCGLPTFSPLLNKFVSYERGEMVVYSGKLKTGKSQLVINEVYRLCITGYNMKYIKSGKYRDNQVAVRKVNEAIEMIRNAPLSHKYVFDMTQEEMYNELKKLKIQMNLQLVFYDYIKANVSSAEDMQERLQMANMTNFLKNKIAGELNVAVVALAQTNPQADGALRIFGSSQVSMFASTIIYLVRKTKEQYERDLNELGGNYYLFIKENRNLMMKIMALMLTLI